jgi:hypothetical protein
MRKLAEEDDDNVVVWRNSPSMHPKPFKSDANTANLHRTHCCCNRKLPKQPMNSCYLAGEEGVRWCGGSHTTRRTTSNHGSTFSKNGFGCKGKGQGGGSVCFREKTELI